MDNIEKIVEEVIPFGPMEMAMEINVKPTTSGTEKKSNKYLLSIVIGVAVVSILIYAIHKYEQKKKQQVEDTSQNNSPPNS